MKITDTLLSLAKVAVKSRAIGKSPGGGRGRRLIVMGNGPSLRDTLANHMPALTDDPSTDTMAVNFAANTPEYSRVKPHHYILADPHFFKGNGDPNVERLWENIAKTDWPMTLHLPVDARKHPAMKGKLAEGVEIRYYNMTPAEGYDAVTHQLFKRGLAMPRPRNVLIPAIIEGIREGYGEIYLAGADHSWPHTLYVDQRNRVVTVQPHFYEDNSKELDRVAEAYAGVHIHDVLGSMVVAFRSYHEIRRFAEKMGVEIYNATPESLIDAFTRKPLP